MNNNKYVEQNMFYFANKPNGVKNYNRTKTKTLFTIFDRTMFYFIHIYLVFIALFGEIHFGKIFIFGIATIRR